MELILGGAYQGKRQFVLEHRDIKEQDIFTCQDIGIDFSKPCIDKLEVFTLACVRQGIDPMAVLREQDLEDKTIICMDLFCGVVPIDADMRAWRHTTGLVCQYLAGRAQHVTRIFCGLEQRMK